MMMRLVSFVVQSHAVELLEGICDFATGGGKSRIERNALHLACAHAEAFVGTTVTDVDTMRLLDVAEVKGVDTTALVGDDGRLGMTEESP